jgi:hypothetical protein
MDAIVDNRVRQATPVHQTKNFIFAKAQADS